MAVQLCVYHARIKSLDARVDDRYGLKLKDKPTEVVEKVESFRARAAVWLERIADEDPLSPCDPATRESFREHWRAMSTDLGLRPQ